MWSSLLWVMWLLAVTGGTGATWKPRIISQYVVDNVLRVSIMPPMAGAKSYYVCVEKRSDVEVVYEISNLSPACYSVLVQAFEDEDRAISKITHNETVVCTPPEERASIPTTQQNEECEDGCNGTTQEPHEVQNEKLIYIVPGVIAVVVVFIVGVLVLLYCTRLKKRQPISRRTSQRQDYTETEYVPRTPPANGQPIQLLTIREPNHVVVVPAEISDEQNLRQQGTADTAQDPSPSSLGDSDSRCHTECVYRDGRVEPGETTQFFTQRSEPEYPGFGPPHQPLLYREPVEYSDQFHFGGGHGAFCREQENADFRPSSQSYTGASLLCHPACDGQAVPPVGDAETELKPRAPDFQNVASQPRTDGSRPQPTRNELAAGDLVFFGEGFQHPAGGGDQSTSLDDQEFLHKA
ncbi:hypothetical protein BaRGS_00009207 [Batillaria attramentaria]|uniref:Uncharacterized protein n=1 Tax=Batillaria attramentaria TaxID=370345 RepID=A0ABD0LJC4_9CAEN